MKHITELNILLDGKSVGILAYRNRQYWFQYSPDWLAHGFDLAPKMLDFNPTPQVAKEPLFQGLHGIFYDSLPDGWGMLLMDRFFKRELGWDHHEITLLDRLAYLGKRAMGALEYEPVLPSDSINETISLSALARDAEKVLAGESQAVLNQLRILGGSPGGARPKVTIALAEDSEDCVAGLTTLPDKFNHWMVKFRSQTDSKDMGCIEKTYSELAQRAGLIVSSSRLIKVPSSSGQNNIFFATQRFDRVGNKKQHMLTLSGYLYADHRLPSLDYNSLLAATAILTKDVREIERAFRLMMFNVLTHNKDDHAKNFAFIYDCNDSDDGVNSAGKWRLSPAYDLIFSSGMNNEHTTSINGSGNPIRKDFAAIAAAHNISHWEKIMEEVLQAVDGWSLLAKKFGVSHSSIKKIDQIFSALRKKF